MKQNCRLKAKALLLLLVLMLMPVLTGQMVLSAENPFPSYIAGYELISFGGPRDGCSVTFEKNGSFLYSQWDAYSDWSIRATRGHTDSWKVTVDKTEKLSTNTYRLHIAAITVGKCTTFIGDETTNTTTPSSKIPYTVGQTLKLTLPTDSDPLYYLDSDSFKPQKAIPTPTPTAAPVSSEKKLSEKKWVSGTTKKNGTADIYTYTMPASSYFYFQVQSIPDDTSVIPGKLDIKLLNGNTSVLNKASQISFKSGYYTFAKGSKITFRISSHGSYAAKYRIRLSPIKPKAFEQEPNTKIRPNALSLGSSKANTFTGLADSRDADYFVFTAKKTGTYRFRFQNTMDSSPVTCCIYNAKWKQLARKSLKGDDGYVTVASKKMKKNAKFYIMIKADSGSGQLYKLRIETK